MRREVGERFKREETYVHLWLIHVDVWQKPSQHCKVTLLQLKIKQKTVKKLNTKSRGRRSHTNMPWGGKQELTLRIIFTDCRKFG